MVLGQLKKTYQKIIDTTMSSYVNALSRVEKVALSV